MSRPVCATNTRRVFGSKAAWSNDVSREPGISMMPLIDTAMVPPRVRCEFATPEQQKRAALPVGTVGLAAPDHLSAIGIERVIDDPFGGVQRVVGVRAVHDPAEQHERSVALELVLLDDRLERTFLAVMTQFDVRHVVGNRIETLGLVHDLVARCEN